VILGDVKNNRMINIQKATGLVDEKKVRKHITYI